MHLFIIYHGLEVLERVTRWFFQVLLATRTFAQHAAPDGIGIRKRYQLARK